MSYQVGPLSPAHVGLAEVRQVLSWSLFLLVALDGACEESPKCECDSVSELLTLLGGEKGMLLLLAGGDIARAHIARSLVL